ncbi:MAG: DUF58 domain-containing protein [Gammaproteobacteria bacterium]
MRLPPRTLYRLFPLVARASRWSERRLTSSGRVMLGLAVAGALFGLDMRQTLAWQVAVLATGLLAASMLVSLRWRPALTVRRVLPRYATDGQPFEYFIEVENRGVLTERDLVLAERLHQPPLPWADFRRRRGRDRRLNPVDRAIGFPRWVELRTRDRGARVALAPVPALAPGARVRVAVSAEPLRRGWIDFTAVEVLRPDPLGLFRARLVLPLHGRLLTLPRRHPVPSLQLAAQRHYQKGGVSLALAVGDSQEFAALREYRHGDPRRHIHWRSFAKTGRLIVRQYQDEYFDRHALIVDTHVDLADEALFEAIVSTAASLAGGPRPRDSLLDLVIAGDAIIELSAGRGLADAARVLSWLAEVQPAGAGNIDTLTECVAHRAGRIASALVVLSRRDPSREALLDTLARHGVRTAALVVSTATQEQPPRLHGTQRWLTLRADHLGNDLAALAALP